MKHDPIFFTSDVHIGHATVLKSTFDNRPFRDLNHMHESFIKRYNATVPENGTCYFLGDIGLCNKTIISDIINQLNGTKVLILGNHDKGITTMKRMGFEVVLNMAAMKICNQLVTMTHCPLRGIKREDTSNMKGCNPTDNWHGEHRNQMFSIPNFGQFHLHGHIHSPNKGQSKKILGRQYDVGVVANNYTPVSLPQIESWVAKTLQKEKNCV